MYIANAHSFISLPASMYHTGFYSSSLMPPMRSSTVIRSISAVMLPSSSSDISESINFSGDAAFLDLLGSPWSALELLVEGWVEGRRGVTWWDTNVTNITSYHPPLQSESKQKPWWNWNYILLDLIFENKVFDQCSPVRQFWSKPTMWHQACDRSALCANWAADRIAWTGVQRNWFDF